MKERKLSEQKRAEIRLIADLTVEATMTVGAKIAGAPERRADEARTRA